MIGYKNDPQQTIPESAIKLVGIGGAGANIIDRAALDGFGGIDMLTINTDMRSLSTSVAKEKIQIGRDLTRGLGAGGDPEVGLNAARENQDELLASLKNHKIVFICVGLGGGTGSGAAPLLARLAREAGAFVVVFATMPFPFEGKRRREQAETSLNELSVLSNALITFDNQRMGELVLADKGIHDAFSAADRMIAQSIQAVTRIVSRPGIINIGLDDLMTALNTTSSRCLFGSGLASGENRSTKSLENALTSPLLDKGALLKRADTVLVHICGGDNLSLYEVELLMQSLSKHVPDNAHILFGVAVDPSMQDDVSVTLISSLPEAALHAKPEPVVQAEPKLEPVAQVVPSPAIAEPVASTPAEVTPQESTPTPDFGSITPASEESENPLDLLNQTIEGGLTETPSNDDDIVRLNAPVFEDLTSSSDEEKPEVAIAEWSTPSAKDEDKVSDSIFAPINEADLPPVKEEVSDEIELPDSSADPVDPAKPAVSPDQAELELDGGPKGKFEGEKPNLYDGEDLDIPPFLRKKK